MSKILVVVQVKDLAKWEEGFRTHGELFRSQGVTKPVAFGTAENNYVAACFEPDDLAVTMKSFGSQATQEAMISDGVVLETVKMFILDQEFKF